MDILQVQGKGKLEGSVKASGAKNAMTKLLVASLLSKKKCVFYNVPAIGDVEITVDLCRELGSKSTGKKRREFSKLLQKSLKHPISPNVFQGLIAFLS